MRLKNLKLKKFKRAGHVLDATKTLKFKIIGLLIFTLISGSFIIKPASVSSEEQNMCETNTDVVFIMDRSGSMSDGERDSLCVWYEREWVGESKQWVKKTKEDVTESWCSAKGTALAPSQYFPSMENKITSAKEAANSFVDLLGEEDQSSLVYFSHKKNEDDWGAKMSKELSGKHESTKSSINSLEANGPTNIGDGLARAIEELKSKRANKDSVKTAILLTDGMANKPNGPGYGENVDDVKYVIEKSLEAASSSVRLFTIGLGDKSGINENMLEQVAENTGAKYYHAPNQKNLEEIYQQISEDVCKFGSISGCNYHDKNQNNQKDEEDGFLSGWEIVLAKTTNAASVQKTGDDGCYNFSGLEPGEYTVSANMMPNWEQVKPSEGYYKVKVDKGENIENLDFVQLAHADKGNIRVCKYEDKDGLASTTKDKSPLKDGGWTFKLKAGASTTKELTTKEGENCVVFRDMEADSYTLTEKTKDGWFAVSPSGGTKKFNLSKGEYRKFKFLNSRLGKISGFKYIDSDGLASTTADRAVSTSTSWEIKLKNISTGETLTTETDDSGYYEFSGLLPGNYKLEEKPISGFVQLEGSEDEFSLESGEHFKKDFVNAEVPEEKSSVSACKYKDLDGIASTTDDRVKLTHEPWTFRLIKGGTTTAELTTKEGENCVTFSDLEEGDYVVEEELKENWQAISPENGSRTVNLGSNDDKVEIFINYFEEPPETGDLKIKKKIDKDGLASTTDDRRLATSTNWNFTLTRTDATSSPINFDLKNGVETFEDIEAGNYELKENLPENWLPLVPSDGTLDIEIKKGTRTKAVFVNYFEEEEEEPFCGNGILENGEECDDGNNINGDGCSATCEIEEEPSNGGGEEPGGGIFIPEEPEPTPEEPEEEEEPAELEFEPVLNIFKEVEEAFANPGDEINYNIRVTNTGSTTAINVVLKDVLPDGFIHTGTATGTENWDLGDIAPGGESVVNFSAEVGENTGAGIYTNTATADAENHEKVSTTSDIEIREGEVKGIDTLPVSGFSLRDLFIVMGVLFTLLFLISLIRERI